MHLSSILYPKVIIFDFLVFKVEWGNTSCNNSKTDGRCRSKTTTDARRPSNAVEKGVPKIFVLLPVCVRQYVDCCC